MSQLHAEPGHFNVLIGATGSVASIKLAELVRKIREVSPLIEVIVITTEKAEHFIDLADFVNSVPVFTDRTSVYTCFRDEWSMWKQRGDPVLHIELRKWAHLYLIAPLDANTLGKLANGLCDNLVACVARAWDISKGPLLFCPAMNTLMYEHPLTRTHIRRLKQRFCYCEIPAISKVLICGDSGIGAMASVDTIVEEVGKVFGEWQTSSKTLDFGFLALSWASVASNFLYEVLCIFVRIAIM